MKVGRRTFVRWSFVAGAGGALSALGLAAVPAARRHAADVASRLLHVHQSPAQRLRSEFDYLNLPDAVIAAYLRDYEAIVGPVSRFSGFPDEFFTRFLLSTDFFQHNADIGRPLEYVTLYGPHQSPCYNPCAVFD
jgi:hypothetical protein